MLALLFSGCNLALQPHDEPQMPLPAKKMASIALNQYPRGTTTQRPPSRQPTLEAQCGTITKSRKWFSRLLGSARSLDDFEHVIHQRKNLKDDKALLNFCHDYRQLKSRPGAKISQCLVWYKAFGPFAPFPVDVCKCKKPSIRKRCGSF
jgi:hypothetical protein